MEITNEKRTKDWSGNGKSIYVTLGASNHVEEDRQEDDYYATEPKAAKLLLELEDFNHTVWECACGEGHLAKVFKDAGHSVLATDLIDRGYGIGGFDFLNCNEPWDGDIITNPPYKYAQEFVEHAMELVSDGAKVAMFLKLQFLEGKARKALFEKYPPKTVYVSSSRLICAKNGDFESVTSSAVAYCWYVFVKGWTGDTTIKWFN